MTQYNPTNSDFTKAAISFASTTLKGLGQIMLQENPVTGLLFLVGLFYSSCLMGMAALVATLVGTGTAILLKYDKANIDKGLYGFSAALVGVALLLFLKPVFLNWVLVVIGSSLAAMIQHFFIQRKIPVFTFPFVLVTWVILLFAHFYLTAMLPAPAAAIAPTIASTSDYFSFGFKGYGQVIFQDNLVAGLLFFLAVFISSPVSALYGLAGAVLSAMVAFNLSVPIHDISIGLFSYNAVLCAIVFAGTQITDGIWVLLSVLLSAAISLLMARFNILPLTFPFVLASCIVVFLKTRPLLLSKIS